MAWVYYHGLQDEPYTTAEIISEYRDIILARWQKVGSLHYELKKIEDKTDLKFVLIK